MNKPIPYDGNEPFIFVSYSHKDSDLVYQLIFRMQKDGFRVWYDDGIDPGSIYARNIGDHIQKCHHLLAFTSKNYINSEFCLNELDFARSIGKNLLVVYTEDFNAMSDLPSDFQLLYGRIEAIFMNKYEDPEDFFKKLYSTKNIGKCRVNSDDAFDDCEPENDEKQEEYFKMAMSAAMNGDFSAQIAVGNYYYHGVVVQRDISEAIRWYRRAADQNVPLAQRHLAYCLVETGGNEEKKEAFNLLKLAASSKLPIAVAELGDCYHSGIGTKVDHFKAAAQYKKAAELGDPRGMFGLAMSYYYGQGRKLDISKAVEWLEKAAELGETEALMTLGGMYYNGEGVPKDLDKAEKLLRQADVKGHPEAKKLLKEIMKK